MPEACTVIIGDQRHLEALRDRAGSDSQVLAFDETEAIGALEAIMLYRPQIVRMERLFAASTRGAALINRIKMDPALTYAEILVVSPDGEYSRVSQRRITPRTVAPMRVPVPMPDTPVAPEAPAAAPELDWRGTRRAPRFPMIPGTEAQVDGSSTMLVNLSSIGAQVVGTAPLRPNQRVRITLADHSDVVRVTAAVAWAAFELPQGRTRYRAGIEFREAKAPAVDAFTERHKT
jgi:hypothetical protein